MDQNWNIAFDGGFFENHSSKRGGKEIKINISKQWGDQIVHIPAIYICSKGLIIDILFEVDSDKFSDFVRKYDLTNDEFAEKLTKEQREEMEYENPLMFDFNKKVTLNEKLLKNKGSSGFSWIPNMRDIVEPRDEATEIIEHYNLDKSKAWAIHRSKFLWATVTKPKIKTLELHLSQRKKAITAGYFENVKVGDEVKVINPENGNEHTVTVNALEQQNLGGSNFANSKYDFPQNCTEMTYTVEPDIPTEKFRIFDCIDSDVPRPNNKNIKPNDNGPTSVGIIGGSDGPIAIITSSKKKDCLKTAISSLHFDENYPIKWRMVFYVQAKDDLNMSLI